MALSQRRHVEPVHDLFRSALVVGPSERETRALVEQAYPVVNPQGARVLLWPPPLGRKRGTPDVILSSIRDTGHDLVVKALERATDRKGALVDALDSGLIRRCPCPVWLADPAQPRPLRRVLAAINPVVGARADLAATILSSAAAVAASAGAELHVLHAWVVYGETLLRPRIAPDELRDYVHGERSAAAERVERCLAEARVRVPASRVHLVKGHFHRVLPPMMERERADLVVMGTRGRRGRTALALLRPYAEALLRHTCGPLLIVKSGSSLDPPGRR